MKIILNDLTITKVYEFKELAVSSTRTGYINFQGAFVAREGDVTNVYEIPAAKTKAKIVVGVTSLTAYYYRFTDANDVLISFAPYTRNGETLVDIPSNAKYLEINQTYGTYTAEITAYAKTK